MQTGGRKRSSWILVALVILILLVWYGFNFLSVKV